MNKSIPSFLFGLILSVVGALCAYLLYAVFILVGTFSNGTAQTLCFIVPFINMATFGLSFIGACLCLVKRKIGGTLMLFASVASLICFIILFSLLQSVNASTLLFMLPTILIFFTSLLAIKKRKK